MVQATEFKEKNTGSSDIEIGEEPKVFFDKSTQPDLEKNTEEEKSTGNTDSDLLSEIRTLFQDKSNSENQVLDEIKELLVELTTEESSDKEKGLLAEITYFKDHRVWVTKKTRMESEARMNNNNIFSLFVVNFYTLIVLSLSILGLVITDQGIIDRISVLTVISSVALFGISLFVSLYGYKEKAISYKQCYLDLTRIESQCQDLILQDLDYENRLTKYNEIKKEYNHILEKTDNHSFADRLVYLRNNKKLNSLDDQIAYYKYKFVKGIIKFSLFIIPIVALIILFVWK
ncbi:SLATT domain-containing protein [Cytobacillus firmus]|uniref:SLATT domain-containing protein n=1 Tax=Cytobacillus firmus TaxID=1399 RepID=UPI00237B6E2B|nr:SLATT domain-containing protein [Cytobacillus firmus]MDD9312586.1 SLATT domain-containing protein [Cytobacillus firmus]